MTQLRTHNLLIFSCRWFVPPSLRFRPGWQSSCVWTSTLRSFRTIKHGHASQPEWVFSTLEFISLHWSTIWMKIELHSRRSSSGWELFIYLSAPSSCWILPRWKRSITACAPVRSSVCSVSIWFFFTWKYMWCGTWLVPNLGHHKEGIKVNMFWITNPLLQSSRQLEQVTLIM